MLRSLHSADHANLRLGRTIVQFKNSPCWIDDIRGDWSANARLLSNGKGFTIRDIRNSDEVNVTPVSLGFCDIGGTARYLSRMPARRTKQGLAQESLYCEGITVPDFYRDSGLAKSLNSCITNEYASYETCFRGVSTDRVTSMAFHRNWAIWKSQATREVVVLFKHFGRVGVANQDGTVRLDPAFSYLQETYLEEVMGNV